MKPIYWLALAVAAFFLWRMQQDKETSTTSTKSQAVQAVADRVSGLEGANVDYGDKLMDAVNPGAGTVSIPWGVSLEYPYDVELANYGKLSKGELATENSNLLRQIGNPVNPFTKKRFKYVHGVMFDLLTGGDYRSFTREQMKYGEVYVTLGKDPEPYEETQYAASSGVGEYSKLDFPILIAGEGLTA